MTDLGDLINALQSNPLIVKTIMVPRPDGVQWAFACTAPLATTADVPIKAGVAGLRSFITSMQLINTNATATEFVVKDGATVIWRGYLPANMTFPQTVDMTEVPLNAVAGATLNVACVTTAAAVYFNAQGFLAP